MQYIDIGECGLAGISRWHMQPPHSRDHSGHSTGTAICWYGIDPSLAPYATLDQMIDRSNKFQCSYH